jgi:predicted dienelactone hydrolase
MSAGGHTALSFAGGRWSPAQLRRHCEAHLAEDFQAAWASPPPARRRARWHQALAVARP